MSVMIFEENTILHQIISFLVYLIFAAICCDQKIFSYTFTKYLSLKRMFMSYQCCLRQVFYKKLHSALEAKKKPSF